jgi:hypothetical protein
MKKTSLSALFFLIAFITILSGCSKPKTAPVSERIAKSWTARRVEENSTTVYTSGAANNVQQGYNTFRLDLSQTSSVTLVDRDGSRSTGQWSVQGDNRLILTNLTPQPTGTNGTIEFTISDLTDTGVVLTRTTASQKTGGTINVYTLKNP